MILGSILLAAGLVGAHGEESLLQYAVRAPAAQEVSQADEGKKFPNDSLLTLTNRLEAVWDELEGSISQKTVSASVSGVSMTSDSGETAEALLTAVDSGYFALYPKLLLAGRLIYPEEAAYGERVIVLDEDLAIRLFMLSDPTDRYVTLAGEEYRVIGVVRHMRSVGEMDAYGAYVPLQRIQKANIDMDMLTVTVRPIAQSGALAAFTSAMQNWQSGGSVYDLDQEAMRAGMLSRLILCGAALYLIRELIRLLNRTAARRIADFRERLRLEYARTLLGGFSGHMLILMAGYLAALGALAGLTVFALQPVYVFPEWIPAVLVEWEDIQTTFWNLTAAAAKPVRCMTQEMLRIEFWARIARWGLILLLFGAAVGRLPKTARD